jgi:hypothetical protein
LSVVGSLNLLHAADRKTMTQANVKLRNGTKVSFGNISVVVDKVGKPAGEKGPTSFVLRGSAADAKQVHSFKLKGAHEEIVSLSVISKIDNGDIEWSQNVRADTVDIEANLWVDLKERTVPFDLTFDLGL